MRTSAALCCALGFCLGLMGPAQGATTGYSAATNYMLRCMGCHGVDGSGTITGGIPDFRNYVGSFAATPMGRAYLLHVPGVIASGLSDEEVAEVLNYIMRRWGGASLPEDFKPFTAQEAADLEKHDIGDVVEYRRQVIAQFRKSNRPIPPYPWP